MKTYQSHLLVFCFLIVELLSFGQKKEKGIKINFKSEIQPLLDQGNTQQAIPLLKNYFLNNLILGDMWNPKVILLESSNMFSAEKIIATYHDDLAFKNLSISHADTALQWYNRMLIDKHADSLKAKDRIIALNQGKSDFPKILAKIEADRIAAEEIKRQQQIAREKFIRDSTETATQKIKELEAYSLALTNRDSISLITYLNTYPNSIKKQEVELIYDSLLFANVITSKNKLNFLGYLKRSNASTLNKNLVTKELIKLYLPISGIASITNLKTINDLFDTLNRLNREYKLTLNIENKLDMYTNDLEELTEKWSVKNLNVAHFINGDKIPQAQTAEEWKKAADSKQPAWCYFDNDSSLSDYEGKLYNWYAINDPRGLLSSNLKIPTINDVSNLIRAAGGETKAGNQLKCPLAWEEEFEIENYTSFDASPHGYRDNQGNFLSQNEASGYWTQTNDSETSAKILFLQKGVSTARIGQTGNKGFGFSIRVIASNHYESNFLEIPELEQLKNKRDELILKEYAKLRSLEQEIDFLSNQVKVELGWKELETFELDYLQLDELHKRIFNNPTIIKNGYYPATAQYSYYSTCGGDGYGGYMAESPSLIGYTNNELNTLKWDNGAIYTGQTEYNLPGGYGKFVTGNDAETGSPGGDIYEGTFEYGMIINGKVTYKDKRVYVGEFTENVPNGYGVMTLANGKKLEGQFEYGEYIKPFTCKTATIGSQVWMAENLAVTKFRNGDDIPEARTISEWVTAYRNGTPAFSYFNNDPATISKYGILYNWFAVTDKRGLAPEGWKVPSHEDALVMFNFINNELNKDDQKLIEMRNQGIDTEKFSDNLIKKYGCSDIKVNGKTVRKISPLMGVTKLKSAQGWPNSFCDYNGTNVYGFNCKPTPVRHVTGEFDEQDETIWLDGACYWTNSYNNSNEGIYIHVEDYHEYSLPYYQGYKLEQFHGIKYQGFEKGLGIPVRCIKQ